MPNKTKAKKSKHLKRGKKLNEVKPLLNMQVNLLGATIQQRNLDSSVDAQPVALTGSLISGSTGGARVTPKP
jgi:hypothetical protein